MGSLFDLDGLRRILVDAFNQLGANVAALFPSLVGAVALLVVGWAVSRIGEAAVGRTLRRVGLDATVARLRLSEVMERGGIATPPSRMVGRLLFWIIMMTFVVSAADALGLDGATSAIDRLIAFLPRLLVAALILFVGLVLARVARSLVSSVAVAGGVGPSERLGDAVRALIMFLVALLALEQLGIETTILVTLMTVVVASVTLTLGFAFALGARPVVSHILAGHFLRQSLERGLAVEVEGKKGTVERVGPVDTLLLDEQGSWSIPNGVLLDEVILR
ncbi:MAG: hypothetical protein OEO23_00450 [Gemmatimonadota bacterium]|nr:hypothetical protein [Gemmatimonadota bacterium]